MNRLFTNKINSIELNESFILRFFFSANILIIFKVKSKKNDSFIRSDTFLSPSDYRVSTVIPKSNQFSFSLFLFQW